MSYPVNPRPKGPWNVTWLRFSQSLTRVVIGTICAFNLSESSVTAMTWSWVGNDRDHLWSNPVNWVDYNVGTNGLPRNGDDLYFNDFSVVTGPPPMMNDLADLRVNSMFFDVSQIVGADWVVNGNQIIISNTAAPPFGGGAIENSQTDNSYVHINCGVKLGTSATFATGGIPVDGSGTIVRMAINGPIDLNNHTLTLLARTADYSGLPLGDSVGQLFIGAPISGNGNVNLISEKGSLIDFNGSSPNSFSGTMTASAHLGAGIQFESSATVVNDALVVNDFGAVVLAKSGQFGDSATVTIMAGAALSIGLNITETIGNLSFINVSSDALPSTLDTGSGTVTLNGSISASCDNDAHTPTIKGKLNLTSGTHSISTFGSAYAGLDVQAQVSGFGGFQKSGSSALILEANNSFNGSISVESGILDVRNDNALGDVGGDTTLFGGSLTLRNVNIGGERLSAEGQGIAGEMPGSLITSIGTNSWAGQVLLDTNLVVIGSDIAFTGGISGAGGIGFFNLGTAVLGGSLGNTYTGTTLVRCPLLEFNKSSGVTACVGPLVVGGGAGGTCEVRWLNSYQSLGVSLTLFANALVNLNNYNEDFGVVTFNGGDVETGTGQFAIYAPLTINASSSSAVINGNLGLPPGIVYFNVSDGAADPDLLINAVVFGDGSPVIKQGAGNMRLTASNSFTGVVVVSEGVLEAYNPDALGSSLAHTIVQPNTTLRLGFSGTMTEPLFLSGSGVGGAGVLEVVGNNFLSLTSVTLDNPSALNVDSGCGATINNAISGNGPLTKIGNGFLQFAGSGNNSYAGDTIVAEGDLNLAKNAFVISVPQNLVVGPASAGSSATARWFQAGGLGGSTVTVNANSLLDLNGNNVNLNLLNLNDGGNVQTRGGTLNLNDGSSINVGSLSPFGSHVASTISGNLGLPIGSTTINVAPHASTPPLLSGPELDIPATISGGSSIQLTVVNKYGAGQLQLDGNNTYASQTRIYEGTLIAAFGGALGSSAVGTYVYNGASLALDNGINVTAELVVLDSTNFAALDSRNGANGWGGEIYLNRDTRINVNNSLIATGVIDGPGSLIKVGLGSLNLSGAPNNTFTGEAFVNQGTLLLNKPAAVTAIPGALEIGSDSGGFSATARNLSSYQIVGNIYVHSTGLYDINGQQENTDALVMYGNGTVQTGAGYLSLKTGAPVFVYPGTNTTATINGSIVMDPGNHLFMVNNGTAIPGVQDVVVNAVMSQISTASSIQKEGAGRMRLTANNTYAGGTAVNAGQLQVDGSQPQSAVTLSNATLQGSGTVGAINITGTSGIIAPGAGLGILTCANFNPGAGGSATLQLELNGTLPGFGHDQLNAQGTVRLTGVKLSPSLGFASSVNDQFTIINNDGSDAVVGTFTGLPQGTNFYISGELFQINYSGGTGNDVVLTRLVTPPKPALTIERVPPKSVRLLWTTNDSAYVLQSESDLAAMNWAVVPTPPVILGNNYVITNVVAGQSKFYRLAK